MAAKNQTVVPTDRAAQINEIMARMRAPKSGKSFVDRLTDAAVDAVADVADVGARFGAAAVSATDNAGDSYSMERERQLKRRAEKLLALAEAVAA